MKLFISWSGERSKALAEALRDWIPLVLHYARPWLSEYDIEAGVRWGDAVAAELEATNFGIICVTRDNVSAPWVLFEAGALAKSLQGSKVIPLLLDLDLSDLIGPLGQFQAKKVDKDGIEEVIRSINQSVADPVPPERTAQLFEALWPKLEEQIDEIPEDESDFGPTRSQQEVLEELVGSVRALDVRFREMAEMPPEFLARRRRRRFHPMMFEELAHMVGEEPGDPIALLMVASMFRDEMPWLYELGMETYRAAKDASPEEAARAMSRFLRAAEFMERGPFGPEEMGVSRDVFMLLRELRHFLDVRMSIGEPQPPPRPRRRRPNPRHSEEDPPVGVTRAGSRKLVAGPTKALDRAPQLVRGDARVALRRVEVLVAEQFLDLAQVCSGAQKL
jgi:hypothetical protein